MIDPLRHRSFLLVEDFEAMRGVLKGQLLRCGATRVDTAVDGLSAVNLLRQNRYDVVMCDYNLGAGKNGQQVLEEARHNGWIGPATVWLMITAEKTNDMVSVAAEEAPDDYLLKPITESVLQARLLKLVERKASLAGIAAAMAANDLRLALSLCDEQLAGGTRYAAEVLRLQAQLYQRLGEWPKARALYEAVLKRGPIPWARLGLAMVHLHQKDVPAARTLLTETMNDHPQYLEAYDSLAQLLAAEGEHAQELAILQRAATISPNSPMRQAALGTAAMKQGQRDVAAAAFKRSMKLAEHSSIEHVDPFVGMARLHSESGAPAEAQKVLAELTKRHDSVKAQALAKAETVRALHVAGDEAGAAQLAGELSGMVQDEGSQLPAETALRIAEALMASNQAEGATRMLQYVSRNNHDNELLLRRAQQVFDDAGMGAAGKELLAAARRQATDAMSAGVMMMSRGDLKGALESLRAATHAMPQNARVLLNFATVAVTCIEQQGHSAAREAEAREAIATAQALRPDDARGAELLARLAKAGAQAA
jgi:DNA-binding response OmpR family regulator/Flp pilus assembly protein TadD